MKIESKIVFPTTYMKVSLRVSMHTSLRHHVDLLFRRCRDQIIHERMVGQLSNPGPGAKKTKNEKKILCIYRTRGLAQRKNEEKKNDFQFSKSGFEINFNI